MDHRIVFGQEIDALDHGEGSFMRRSDFLRRRREIGGAHVACRRVDEVAREEGRAGKAALLFAVDALRQDEPRPFACAARIAREAIGAEREGEDRLRDVAMHFAREAVVARRQRCG